jgi:KDO2-lipid IV(A) lauroyltransferase
MKKNTSFAALLSGGFLRLIGHLPLGWHRWWGRVLGDFVRGTLHYRNDVVTANLARCFPDKSYDELRAISKRFYRHFATTLTEMIWFGACRGEWGRKRLHRSHIVEITNPEELNRLYAGAPQLMMLQAHTGNWELIGGIRNYAYGTELAIMPDSFAVTHMRLHSRTWDQVMAMNRTAPVADQGFDGYVESAQVLRFALNKKGRKFGYSFITDQSPYTDYNHPQVEFMHQPTAIMTAAASLACKMDMAVVYLRYECREDGGYRMTFVPISDHAKGEDPLQIMERYYQLLQEDLEKQPWNYLWTHKRWK